MSTRSATPSENAQERPCKMQRQTVLGRRDDDRSSSRKTSDDDISQTQILTFLEFYCGVGGWAMALEVALKCINNLSENGEERTKKFLARCVGAFDHSDLCTKVYMHNFGKTYQFTNPSQTRIENLTEEQIPPADIWMASPPCQPHTRQHESQNADLEDPRSKSFLHICDLIELLKEEKLPRLILIENVVGFEASNSCNRMRRVMLQRGYSVSHFHLSPPQVGIPNDRPRYYCVAVKVNLSKNQQNVDDASLTKQVAFETQNSAAINSAVKVQTQLEELNVVAFPPIANSRTETSSTTNDIEMSKERCLFVPCISEFIDVENNDNPALRIPEKTLSSNTAWCFDIVTPEDRRSSCFTQAYGRFVRGTGSVLYFGDQKVGDIFKLVPPEEREFNKDWAKELDLINGMRYFSGNEIARLMDFREGFTFPEDCTLKQQWKLLGNSLNVRVTAKLCELGLRIILQNDETTDSNKMNQ